MHLIIAKRNTQDVVEIYRNKNVEAEIEEILTWSSTTLSKEKEVAICNRMPEIANLYTQIDPNKLLSSV